jgi:RNA polymerase sigma-70 factor (ECF subfamily)
MYTAAHITPASTVDSVEIERALICKLLRDDPNGWREFNERYARLIHRCIAKILNRFSAVATSDDTAEIYATLCLQLLARDKHKLRSFDSERGSKLGTWLGMLATHAAYDFLRQRRRDPRASDDIGEAEQMRASTPPPDEICEVRQRAQWVAELLHEFSDKDREFMTLYFGEGLAPEQVAVEMGISVKTVYSKKHKIQARLEGIVARRQLAA